MIDEEKLKALLNKVTSAVNAQGRFLIVLEQLVPEIVANVERLDQQVKRLEEQMNVKI